YKNDISVRISKVPEFLEKMNALLEKEYPQFEVVWFGHIGDGNLHINILKPADWDSKRFVDECKRVNDHMYDLIQKLQGSVSAEHGVGLTKKPYLQFTRSQVEIEYLKGIKRVFDPDGIMNPGKLMDL
ncbi:MAG: FAD-binding oxidoreductase, partial [Bdellovibrionales bacterium]|nr:FAD-binding oxidoreductase [Bdellovibrionales bacterium]